MNSTENTWLVCGFCNEPCPWWRDSEHESGCARPSPIVECEGYAKYAAESEGRSNG